MLYLIKINLINFIFIIFLLNSNNFLIFILLKKNKFTTNLNKFYNNLYNLNILKILHINFLFLI